MQSNLLSRRDLAFLLYEWLNVEKLTSCERFSDHSRETFDAVLELSEQIAQDRFAPALKKSDIFEPALDGEVVTTLPEIKSALAAFAKAGFVGASLDYDLGGMQLPRSVATAGLMWFKAGSIASTSYASLTMGNANLLLTYGTEEQIDRFVRPMIEGRFFGTMCLSEPHAGSSLSDILTRAEPQEDGSYRLFGNKMWISAGDHEISENIVHLVLAKIPGSPAGTKGISLFIVPKHLVDDEGAIGERNDVVTAGLNHKMGYRGTSNALLNFGEGRHQPGGKSGAVGYLVGEPNKGLTYMFHMMNEARIGVGAGAVAIGYTGYLKSLEYAKNRPQGRPLTNKDPLSPQIPIIEHADVKRMLLAQKSYVEGGLALILYCAHLFDQSEADPANREKYLLLLDTLTPIAKSWPSQWCVNANDLAIQIHGGYGYTREYDVEQHYRDNRLNAIHEGTHGIQALDLLGRKVILNGGAGLMAIAEAMTTTISEAQSRGDEAASFAAELQRAIERIGEVTATVWMPMDPEGALANATAYLEATGHAVMAWLWLEQFLAAGDQVGAFYEGKRQTTRYFFAYELPKIYAQLDLVAAMDRTTLEMQPDWF
jgi:alkylation response protein AidB-like acyl-CoA dehydrogenase